MEEVKRELREAIALLREEAERMRKLAPLDEYDPEVMRDIAVLQEECAFIGEDFLQERM